MKRLLIPAYVALLIKLLAMCTPPNDGGHIVLPSPSPSSPAPALVDPADDSPPVAEEGTGGVATRTDSKLKSAPALKAKRPANGRREAARPYERPRATGVA